MSQNSIITSGNVAIDGTQQPIAIATALPGDNRGSVDVFVYAASGNAAVVRLTNGSQSRGVVLPPGQSVNLTEHIVSDTALYALGTNGDEIEWSLIGPPNPSV